MSSLLCSCYHYHYHYHFLEERKKITSRLSKGMRITHEKIKLLLLTDHARRRSRRCSPATSPWRPARPRPAAKNAIKVKLFVELIHKRCPVDIEKTRLVTAGAAIASQGQWKKVAAGIYQKDLIVSLNGKGKGEIRVHRDCPKTGQQEETLEIDRHLMLPGGTRCA